MTVSVVIPVFNSSKTIEEVVKRVIGVMELEKIIYEILLIDDGSFDDSWIKIKELSKNNLNIISIKLLKNYGQHNANLCGFMHSSNQVIITLDDDLQNPPEEIPKLLQAISQGHDLVYGEFEQKKHNVLRLLGSRAVQHLNKKIFKIRADVSITNFRAISRDVVDLICQENHFNPYIPGLVLKYSTNIGNVKVLHNEREYGKSNYTFKKLISLVFDLLFHHSHIPLRLVTVIGLFSSFGVFLLGTYILIQATLNGYNAPGWASLAVLISLSSALIIMIVSVVGEYLIRILNQIAGNTSYTVKQIINK